MIGGFFGVLFLMEGNLAWSLASSRERGIVLGQIQGLSQHREEEGEAFPNRFRVKIEPRFRG